MEESFKVNSIVKPLYKNELKVPENNTAPKDWRVCKIGDILEFEYGKSLVKSERSNIGDFKVYGSSGFVGLHNKCLVNEQCIIVGRKGSVGAVYLSKLPCWPIDTTYYVTPGDNFNLAFLYYQFIHLQLNRIEKSTAIPGLSRNDIYAKEIVVPPIPEQHLIVEKIEELFSELDAGRRQLETVRQQLKTYRQSVLKYAFEGKLTNNNVKNGDLPAGWKSVELKGLCNKIQDGSHFSPQMQYTSPGEERYKYITAKNIRNNHMDLSTVKYVDKQFHDSIFHRCNPEFGDVLLTKDGVNTGEITLNTLNEEISLLSSVCLFKTNKELLSSAYLKYYIQSPFGSKIIDGSMTGTAIKRIILRKIKEARIVVPPIIVQQRITQEIESRFTICDKLEEIIEECLRQSEALKQSILKQAFEGKLVKPLIS